MEKKRIILQKKTYQPDPKKIKAKVRSLHIPKEYWGIDIDEFFSYQWNIYLSIRETAGKTTQSLIFGLVLNSLYPDKYTIEYLRNDQSQTTKANIETIFDTIIALGYIQRIYDGRWNAVTYYAQRKKFYLCKKDGDGNIIDEDPDAICAIHSIERYADYKSSYSNPRGKYIIVDEFPDTSRATYQIFFELLNCISTIGRPLSPGSDGWLRILMMGNNTDEYCWLWDDLCISGDIPNLTFGGKIEFRTEYNTTGVVRLLEVGEVQKKRLEEKNIPFLGFPGKKAAAFTGVQEWSGKTYRHLDFELNYSECVFRRMYMRHRGRWVQFDLFRDEEHGEYIFAHFSMAPLFNDNIIFTLDPKEFQDIYGFGKYEKRERVLKVCRKIVLLFQENRFYFASNAVGSLMDDFIKNIQ